MRVRSSRKSAQRGAALVLFVVMLTLVLIPMLGLAIDTGWMYYAHSRLVAAADSAALAGARSLNIGQSLTAQQGNAQTIATQYIQANIPTGMLNSSNLNIPLPLVQQTSTHLWTVSVNPSLTVNLFFMPILGFRTATVSAYAQSSRRDVNIMLVLDKSGSMGQVCTVMTSDAANFVSKFAQGRDALGLITFMGNPNLDVPLTTNFQTSITNALSSVTCSGNTGSAAALYMAHSQIIARGQPGALNVIVFFTDGVPNGYSAAFPPKRSTCNGGNPVTGYIAENGGIFPTASSDNGSSPQTVSGCRMSTSGPSGLSYSFSLIPEQDVNGSLARGLDYVLLPGGNITFSTANSDAVSANAADYAAQQARKDTSVGGITIYTIGLDGNGGVDGTLLERLANDPASPIYDSTQPTGKYYYSPNAGQLASIWNSIASQILRIAQ